MLHCKKCNSKEFESISTLRKHQWKEHPEFYEKLRQSGKKEKKIWSKAQRAKYKETMALRAQHEVYLNGSAAPMSAAQLLERLKQQRNFMNDVVSLVEGLIK